MFPGDWRRTLSGGQILFTNDLGLEKALRA
jgi:hypothetical protein